MLGVLYKIRLSTFHLLIKLLLLLFSHANATLNVSDTFINFIAINHVTASKHGSFSVTCYATNLTEATLTLSHDL